MGGGLCRDRRCKPADLIQKPGTVPMNPKPQALNPKLTLLQGSTRLPFCCWEQMVRRRPSLSPAKIVLGQTCGLLNAAGLPIEKEKSDHIILGLRVYGLVREERRHGKLIQILINEPPPLHRDTTALKRRGVSNQGSTLVCFSSLVTSGLYKLGANLSPGSRSLSK